MSRFIIVKDARGREVIVNKNKIEFIEQHKIAPFLVMHFEDKTLIIRQESVYGHLDEYCIFLNQPENFLKR